MIDKHRYDPATDHASEGSAATLTDPEREPITARAAVATGTRLRIALAHDWLVGYRGGEAVLEHIARVAHRRGEIAGIYTMFASPGWQDGFPIASNGDRGVRDAARIHTSFLNRWPKAQRMRRWMLPLYPRAVDELSRRLARNHAREPIDLLISTSSAAIKGLRAPAGVKHICYCHAPARYLWSQAEQYAIGRGGGLRTLGLKMFGTRLRGWDKETSDNVHIFLANSSHIQASIRDAYGRASRVIHPPVDTDYFSPLPRAPQTAEKKLFEPPAHVLAYSRKYFPNAPIASPLNIRDAAAARAIQGGCMNGYWVHVGALEPYKRIDLVIRAAAKCGAELLIVGAGSQEGALRALARVATKRSDRIRLLGRVPNAEVRNAMQLAAVFIFPQIEDFGIVAVEAQACGLPVVAYRAGGALDTVIDGRTGVFFDEQTPEAIAAAVQKCLALGDVSAACRANAERFCIARFEREIDELIAETLRG